MLESDKESRWYVPQKLMLFSNNKSKENSDHLLFQLMGFFLFFFSTEFVYVPSEFVYVPSKKDLKVTNCVQKKGKKVIHFLDKIF